MTGNYLSTGFGKMMSRALPLANHTKLWLYTFPDLLKPGPQDVYQSTLPFYELAIICIAFVVWIVVFVYFWKMIYYPVNDPYATPYGTAPPFEKRLMTSFPSPETIMDYIYKLSELFK